MRVVMRLSRNFDTNLTPPMPKPLFYVFITRKNTKAPGLALLLFTLIVLHACQYQNTTLRVGTNIWPGYEPFYLARSLDYYKATPIHMVELPSATAVIRHLNSGSIDAACLTLDETLTVISYGVDVKIIAVLDFSNGADVILGQPQITSLASLHGKTIGVEQTAVGAVLLEGALQTANISVQDIKLKYLTADQHERAWITQQVDAVVTYEPYRTRLLSHGATQLFDSSEIPGRITDVLVVKKEVMRHHASALQQLLDGYFRALHYMKNNPRDAARRMSGRLGVLPSEVPHLFKDLTTPTLSENKRLLQDKKPLLQANINQLTKIMLDNQLIEKKPDKYDFLSDRYLPDSIE